MHPPAPSYRAVYTSRRPSRHEKMGDHKSHEQISSARGTEENAWSQRSGPVRADERKLRSANVSALAHRVHDRKINGTGGSASPRPRTNVCSSATRVVPFFVDWVSSALPVVTCASLRHPVAYDAARLCGTGARAVAGGRRGLRSVHYESNLREGALGKSLWPLERLRLCTKQSAS